MPGAKKIIIIIVIIIIIIIIQCKQFNFVLIQWKQFNALHYFTTNSQQFFDLKIHSSAVNLSAFFSA